MPQEPHRRVLHPDVDGHARTVVCADDRRGARRLAALTLEQKVRLLTGADVWALHARARDRAAPRSSPPTGRPACAASAGTSATPSANVPVPHRAGGDLGRGAGRAARPAAGRRVPRKGVDVLLAPTVNLHRTPYGGRHFECFSEDPLLTARIGAAYVRGLQDGGVGATVKHFVANDSETERFTLDARVDERALRELYLAPFEAIVRDARPVGGHGRLQRASTAHTMTESPLLRDVLKDEWGFDGVVMSDWYAGRSTERPRAPALDLRDARPDRPVGRRARRRRARRARCRGGGRRQGAAAAAAGRARRRARRRRAAGAARAPWTDGGGRRASCAAAAAAGFVLARNEAALLPLAATGCAASRSSARTPRRARTLGGGSATVFPPLHRLAAGRAARRARRRRRGRARAAACSATRGIPRRRAPELLRRRHGAGRDFLGADGAVLGTERRAGGAYTWLGAFAEDVATDAVAAVEVHARLRAREAGALRRRLLGRRRASRLTVDGARGVRRHAGAAAGRRPGRGASCARRSTACRSTLGGRARRSTSSCATSSRAAGERRSTCIAVTLPAQRRAAARAATTRSSSAPWAGRGRRRRRRRRRHHRGGRERGLRPRLARAARPPGRAGPRASPPPTRGRSWSSTPARRCCCRGPTTSPAVLLDLVPAARSSATRWPTSCSAPSSPAAGCPPPGRRPRTGCRPRSPPTACSHYDEGLFVGYRATGRDGRQRRSRSATASATRHGSTWTSTIERPTARQRARAQHRRPRAAARSSRSTRRRPDSAVERPPRWLAGFAAVEAAPGEEVTVRDRRVPRAPSRTGTPSAFVVEPGRSRSLRPTKHLAKISSQASRGPRLPP